MYCVVVLLFEDCVELVSSCGVVDCESAELVVCVGVVLVAMLESSFCVCCIIGDVDSERFVSVSFVVVLLVEDCVELFLNLGVVDCKVDELLVVPVGGSIGMVLLDSGVVFFVVLVVSVVGVDDCE